MQPQLQNWDNFCKYHVNHDWYGVWTKYLPDGEVTDSFQCIRSFHLNQEGNEINHQNHYIYADGKKETKTFGPYKKPDTRALFLDNSFSWGSILVLAESRFGFETGFRYEDKRLSTVVIYNESGNLQEITVISEVLQGSSQENNLISQDNFSGLWEGTAKTINPNYVVSSPVHTTYKQLKKSHDNYLNLFFPEGVSINCPMLVEAETNVVAGVDWLINPNLLQSGIRNYDASGFIGFTFAEFNRS
ncbi:MAG: DUF3598 family protein [Cyanobacteria bacterium P01_D01_bin.116]